MLTTAILAAAEGMPAAQSNTAYLLKLEADFNAAYERLDASIEKLSHVEGLAFAVKPPMPTEVPMPDDLVASVNALSVEGFRDANNPVRAAFDAHLNEDRRRRAAWTDECEEALSRFGVPEARAENDQRVDEVDEIAQAILHVRAQSLANIGLKLRVHERWSFEAHDLIKAITADLAAIAEHATSMTPRDRLTLHGREYARAAQEIDPSATEVFFGEALDDNLTNRFSVIVTRPQAGSK